MAFTILVVALLFCGVLMTLIPTLPGVPFMFLLTAVYAFADRFETLTPMHLLIFGLIALLSIIIDYSSGIIGAKLGGASRKALLWGLIGLVAGVILFPPFGAFIGLFIGVFLAEVLQFQDQVKAFKAASYSVAASVAGMMANIGLALGFFITFVVIVF